MKYEFQRIPLPVIGCWVSLTTSMWFVLWTAYIERFLALTLLGGSAVFICSALASCVALGLCSRLGSTTYFL